jgi:hypothetical protein
VTRIERGGGLRGLRILSSDAINLLSTSSWTKIVAVALIFASVVNSAKNSFAAETSDQSEHGQTSATDSVRLAIVLGGRFEWAVSLQQVPFSLGLVGKPDLGWPFFFLPRLEVSPGVMSDEGFVLGTFVIGPGFWTRSLAGDQPYPQYYQFLLDFGVKWGGVVHRKRGDVLVGPRITIDLGIPPETWERPSLYGTFGATFGFSPRTGRDNTRFIFMIEPGIVFYGYAAYFSLSFAAGGMILPRVM